MHSFTLSSIFQNSLLLSNCTGQKGIGFKSVFRVTNKPEVHSNGFHLRFDATSGPNGYILPEWVNEGHEMDYKVPTGAQQSIKKYVTQ